METSQVEVVCFVIHHAVLHQLSIGTSCHFTFNGRFDVFFYFHSYRIDDGCVEIRLLFACNCQTGFFFPIIEVVQSIVRFAVGKDTGACQLGPVGRIRYVQSTFIEDCQVFCVQLCINHLVFPAIGRHDDECIVVNPGMCVGTHLIAVGLEGTFCNYLNSIVLDLIFHETVIGCGNLVVIFSFRDSLHGVISQFRTFSFHSDDTLLCGQ